MLSVCPLSVKSFIFRFAPAFFSEIQEESSGSLLIYIYESVRLWYQKTASDSHVKEISGWLYRKCGPFTPPSFPAVLTASYPIPTTRYRTIYVSLILSTPGVSHASDIKMGKPRLIILIRHAQSEGNKNRAIHQMIPDHRVKLTEEGWKQVYLMHKLV